MDIDPAYVRILRIENKLAEAVFEKHNADWRLPGWLKLHQPVFFTATTDCDEDASDGKSTLHAVFQPHSYTKTGQIANFPNLKVFRFYPRDMFWNVECLWHSLTACKISPAISTHATNGSSTKPNIPTWAVYHSLISEVAKHQTYIRALPLISSPVHRNMNTAHCSLSFNSHIISTHTSYGSWKRTIITFDMDLYIRVIKLWTGA